MRLLGSSRGISGPHHAAAAVAAAIDLAERAAQATTTPVSIPVGTAVHTGEAFVGATRLDTTDDDFTALGDVVNITARLASTAAAGEVIVSVAAAEAAGLVTDHPERRTVDIRGRTEPIEVVVSDAKRTTSRSRGPRAQKFSGGCETPIRA
jgi:adenylate cyclase